MKRLQAATLATLGLALSTLTGASAASPKPAPAPAAATKVEQIELFHAFDADAAARLASLVDRYNGSQTRTRVVLTDRNWRKGPAPDLLALDDEEASAFLKAKPGIRPLHQVMKDAGRMLETLRPPPTMTSRALDSQNRLLALPIGLATPVMFFNKTAVRAAGFDPEKPPATWQGLQDWLGALYDKGIDCPYTTSRPVWVHLENTSAWHNEPAAVGHLSLNGLLQVKHLAMMSSWYKSRYLHIFGRGDEADTRFTSGECAVITTASSRYPGFLRSARFELGVAPLPYQEDYHGAPQNTLADGPSIWIANGRSEARYRAIADFIVFLLSPEIQIEMQTELGGLPVNRAGAYAARGELLKGDLAGVRVAIATLTNKPATDQSRASMLIKRSDIQLLLNEALEAVWENKKPPKQALDDAVARAR